MRAVAYYLITLLFNGAILWLIISGIGYTVQDIQHLPQRGDLRAVYLPLTAFAYTAQMVSVTALIAILNWQISRVFHLTHDARKEGKKLNLHKHMPMYFAGSFAVILAGVADNKAGWWIKLVFGNDRYGYYSKEPAVAALVVALGALICICATIWQIKGKKTSLLVTLSVALLVLFLSYQAALKVAVSLV